MDGISVCVKTRSVVLNLGLSPSNNRLVFKRVFWEIPQKSVGSNGQRSRRMIRLYKIENDDRWWNGPQGKQTDPSRGNSYANVVEAWQASW